MSQNNIDKAKPQRPRLKRTRLSSGKSDPRPVGSTPRQDKIRIVLEGFCGEVTVSDLCRRERIKPGVFYAWTKDPSASSGDASWKRGKSVSPGTR